MTVLFRIVEDDHPPFPAGVSDELRLFLKACFQKEPERRWTAAQLLQHPWIVKNHRPSAEHGVTVRLAAPSRPPPLKPKPHQLTRNGNSGGGLISVSPPPARPRYISSASRRSAVPPSMFSPPPVLSLPVHAVSTSSPPLPPSLPLQNIPRPQASQPQEGPGSTRMEPTQILLKSDLHSTTTTIAMPPPPPLQKQKRIRRKAEQRSSRKRCSIM